MTRKIIFWTSGLSIILIFSMIMAISIGSVSLSIDSVIRIILQRLLNIDLHAGLANGLEVIIWNIRLPRILLAILVGAMLSISGVAFQGVLRNPLADPYILGVSSGGALGAATTMLFIHQLTLLGAYTTPFFAFIGSILTLGIVILLANSDKLQKNETLILAGVVVQALTGAILSFLMVIADEKLQSIVFWMMGSLANRDWNDFFILLPYFFIGTIYILIQFRELNVMALGEQAAVHLGVDVQKKKKMILVAGALLASSAVSVVGIIGFVGLVVPHIMRLVVGANHRILIPVSTLAGAIFLLWSDTLARTIIPSREIPIGVITAFIGAPFFAYLLIKKQRRLN